MIDEDAKKETTITGQQALEETTPVMHFEDSQNANNLLI